MGQTPVPSDRPLSPDECQPARDASCRERDVRHGVIYREINACLARGQYEIDLTHRLGYIWAMHSREVRAVLDAYRASGWQVRVGTKRHIGAHTTATFTPEPAP